MITFVNANHDLLERRVKVNLDSSSMEEWSVIFCLPAMFLLVFLFLLFSSAVAVAIALESTASTANAKTVEAVTTYLMLIGVIFNQGFKCGCE